MPESFSRRLLDIDMEEEDNVLDVLSSIFETERTFFGTVRFLEGTTRNHIVAAQLRNTGVALHILRTFMERPPPRATMVMSIDLSGNFLDPVPVIPTREQIANGTDTNVVVVNTNCAICQDSVISSTRLRACGHCFHAQCIDQWLGMNPRCPICRHDIREPLTNTIQQTINENNSMYPQQ